ncbi:hypothetical protein ABK976_22825 [Vibrio parahaemolyticus]|uniref:hypothetical protein n=1 Tax=Vibrio parahaemolyticus TaxID=670 RepID=UPI0021124A67|nr:hypothetical protein [Vibrio parahaemolyticus]MCQ6434769.1 hypothetical protein [Vibrio parahaemolyticus]MCQ6443978.1 hypothetical protein [Vibrio parahaemolyticus]MDI7915759.1 hypothetical protein [Vibrio parahaemolyticus]
MNKTEINAQLDALEAALDKAGVDYVKANREQTNPELEKEIARLESLLPDEDDENTSVQSSTETAQEQDQQAKKSESQQAETQAKPAGETRQIKINKGVNIEITLGDKKLVLQGGKTYTIPEKRARSIVAENLGAYEDDSV